MNQLETKSFRQDLFCNVLFGLFTISTTFANITFVQSCVKYDNAKRICDCLKTQKKNCIFADFECVNILGLRTSVCKFPIVHTKSIDLFTFSLFKTLFFFCWNKQNQMKNKKSIFMTQVERRIVKRNDV